MMTSLFAQATNYYNPATMTDPQQTAAANAASAVTLLMVILLVTAVLVVTIVGLWKVYRKAGRPGWAAIVPIYSQWVLAEIAGKPGWWALLQFIPIVNIVITLLIALGVARNFGKGPAFGVIGLLLFSVIGYLILGFGSATYRGNGPVAPAGQQMPPAMPPTNPGNMPSQIS